MLAGNMSEHVFPKVMESKKKRRQVRAESAVFFIPFLFKIVFLFFFRGKKKSLMADGDAGGAGQSIANFGTESTPPTSVSAVFGTAPVEFYFHLGRLPPCPVATSVSLMDLVEWTESRKKKQTKIVLDFSRSRPQS